jgi:dienelactone hydrolase
VIPSRSRLLRFATLAVTAAALLSTRGVLAQETAGADVKADAPALPKLLPAKELRKQAQYVHANFEMTVNPPIDAGDGVFVETLKFPSPIESVDPERNDVVKARLFRTEKPAKAAVIALGGWKFDPLTPELSRELAKSGIQVVWLEIPFQGQRTPKGQRPGALTLSADLEQNERTFLQLAQDVGRLRHWLIHEREVDSARIGLLGTSLGGFAAATLYGMQSEHYDVVSVQLAGADIAAVLFNGNWLTRRIEAGLRKQGVDGRTASKLLAPMSPATWVDPDRGDGVLLVAAELDEIVPLHTVQDLCDRYHGSEMVIMKDAPHRAADGLREALPKVRAHFERHLLAKDGDSTKKPD